MSSSGVVAANVLAFTRTPNDETVEAVTAAPWWLVGIAAVVGVAIGPGLDRAIAHAIRLRTVGNQAAKASTNGWPTFWSRTTGLSIATGVLEAALAARFGVSWSLLIFGVFFPGLVALAWCDGQYYLLPKRILWPTLVASGGALVLAGAATHEWHRFGIAFACGACAFAVFLALHLVSPKGMAFGDVRLAGTIGLVIGWLGVDRVLGAFSIASIVGAFVAIALLATRRGQLDSHLPYGVFLAIGAVLALLG